MMKSFCIVIHSLRSKRFRWLLRTFEALLPSQTCQTERLRLHYTFPATRGLF